MESFLEEHFLSIFGPNHNDDFSSESSDAEGHKHEENEIIMEKKFTNNLKTNMVFESKESLFAACQAYAKSRGFSVIYRTAKKVAGSNDAKYLFICCDRARKVDAKKSTKKNRCPARVNAIKQDNGCWRISTIHLIHNHELEPHMSIFMAAHRGMSINMRRQLEGNDISGLKVCKNVRLLEVQVGGPMNLGCNARDCRNYIEKRRRLRLGEGDAEATRTLFMRMQKKDRNFFHLMDIDDKGRVLRNVMWIHSRGKAAYADILIFMMLFVLTQYIL